MEIMNVDIFIGESNRDENVEMYEFETFLNSCRLIGLLRRDELLKYRLLKAL